MQSLFRRLLKTYLKDYVDIEQSGLDKVAVSLWNGNVVLKDLALRKDVLKKFVGDGIDFTEAIIGTIDIAIPWTSLTSSAVKVKISDIRVGLEVTVEDLKPPIPPTREEILKKRREVKRAKLDRIEAFLTSTVDNAVKNASKQAGAQSGFVKKIVDNIQVEVEKIHLKVYSKEAGTIGISISEISVNSADENWKKKFVVGKTDLRKMLSIKNIFLYLNQGKTSNAELDVFDINKRSSTFQQLCYEEEISAKVLMRGEGNEMSKERFNVNLKIGDICFSLRRKQYLSAMKLLKALDKNKPTGKSAPTSAVVRYKAPLQRPVTSELKLRWWNYSILNTISIKKERDLNSFKLKWLNDVEKDYIKMYKHRLECTKSFLRDLTSKEIGILKLYERNDIFDIENIMRFRRVAEEEARIELKVKGKSDRVNVKKLRPIKEEAKKGYFSGWFGGSKDSEEASAEDTEEKKGFFSGWFNGKKKKKEKEENGSQLMSDAERKELMSTIGFDMKKMEKESVSLDGRKEFLKLSFALNLVSFALIDEDKEISLTELSGISTALEVRSNFVEAKVDFVANDLVNRVRGKSLIETIKVKPNMMELHLKTDLVPHTSYFKFDFYNALCVNIHSDALVQLANFFAPSAIDDEQNGIVRRDTEESFDSVSVAENETGVMNAFAMDDIVANDDDEEETSTMSTMKIDINIKAPVIKVPSLSVTKKHQNELTLSMGDVSLKRVFNKHENAKVKQHFILQLGNTNCIFKSKSASKEHVKYLLKNWQITGDVKLIDIDGPKNKTLVNLDANAISLCLEVNDLNNLTDLASSHLKAINSLPSEEHQANTQIPPQEANSSITLDDVKAFEIIVPADNVREVESLELKFCFHGLSISVKDRSLTLIDIDTGVLRAEVLQTNVKEKMSLYLTNFVMKFGQTGFQVNKPREDANFITAELFQYKFVPKDTTMAKSDILVDILPFQFALDLDDLFDQTHRVMEIAKSLKYKFEAASGTEENVKLNVVQQPIVTVKVATIDHSAFYAYAKEHEIQYTASHMAYLLFFYGKQERKFVEAFAMAFADKNLSYSGYLNFAENLKLSNLPHLSKSKISSGIDSRIKFVLNRFDFQISAGDETISFTTEKLCLNTNAKTLYEGINETEFYVERFYIVDSFDKKLLRMTNSTSQQTDIYLDALNCLATKSTRLNLEISSTIIDYPESFLNQCQKLIHIATGLNEEVQELFFSNKNTAAASSVVEVQDIGHVAVLPSFSVCFNITQEEHDNAERALILAVNEYVSVFLEISDINCEVLNGGKGKVSADLNLLKLSYENVKNPKMNCTLFEVSDVMLPFGGKDKLSEKIGCFKAAITPAFRVFAEQMAWGLEGMLGSTIENTDKEDDENVEVMSDVSLDGKQEKKKSEQPNSPPQVRSEDASHENRPDLFFVLERFSVLWYDVDGKSPIELLFDDLSVESSHNLQVLDARLGGIYLTQENGLKDIDTYGTAYSLLEANVDLKNSQISAKMAQSLNICISAESLGWLQSVLDDANKINTFVSKTLSPAQEETSVEIESKTVEENSFALKAIIVDVNISLREAKGIKNIKSSILKIDTLSVTATNLTKFISVTVKNLNLFDSFKDNCCLVELDNTKNTIDVVVGNNENSTVFGFIRHNWILSVLSASQALAKPKRYKNFTLADAVTPKKTDALNSASVSHLKVKLSNVFRIDLQTSLNSKHSIGFQLNNFSMKIVSHSFCYNDETSILPKNTSCNQVTVSFDSVVLDRHFKVNRDIIVLSGMQTGTPTVSLKSLAFIKAKDINKTNIEANFESLTVLIDRELLMCLAELLRSINSLKTNLVADPEQSHIATEVPVRVVPCDTTLNLVLPKIYFVSALFSDNSFVLESTLSMNMTKIVRNQILENQQSINLKLTRLLLLDRRLLTLNDLSTTLSEEVERQRIIFQSGFEANVKQLWATEKELLNKINVSIPNTFFEMSFSDVERYVGTSNVVSNVFQTDVVQVDCEEKTEVTVSVQNEFVTRNSLELGLKGLRISLYDYTLTKPFSKLNLSNVSVNANSQGDESRALIALHDFEIRLLNLRNSSLEPLLEPTEIELHVLLEPGDGIKTADLTELKIFGKKPITFDLAPGQFGCINMISEANELLTANLENLDTAKVYEDSYQFKVKNISGKAWSLRRFDRHESPDQDEAVKEYYVEDNNEITVTFDRLKADKAETFTYLEKSFIEGQGLKYNKNKRELPLLQVGKTRISEGKLKFVWSVDDFNGSLVATLSSLVILENCTECVFLAAHGGSQHIEIPPGVTKSLPIHLPGDYGDIYLILSPNDKVMNFMIPTEDDFDIASEILFATKSNKAFKKVVEIDESGLIKIQIFPAYILHNALIENLSIEIREGGDKNEQILMKSENIVAGSSVEVNVFKQIITKKIGLKRVLKNERENEIRITVAGFKTYSWIPFHSKNRTIPFEVVDSQEKKHFFYWQQLHKEDGPDMIKIFPKAIILNKTGLPVSYYRNDLIFKKNKVIETAEKDAIKEIVVDENKPEAQVKDLTRELFMHSSESLYLVMPDKFFSKKINTTALTASQEIRLNYKQISKKKKKYLDIVAFVKPESKVDGLTQGINFVHLVPKLMFYNETDPANAKDADIKIAIAQVGQEDKKLTVLEPLNEATSEDNGKTLIWREGENEFCFKVQGGKWSVPLCPYKPESYTFAVNRTLARSATEQVIIKVEIREGVFEDTFGVFFKIITNSSHLEWTLGTASIQYLVKNETNENVTLNQSDPEFALNILPYESKPFGWANALKPEDSLDLIFNGEVSQNCNFKDVGNSSLVALTAGEESGQVCINFPYVFCLQANDIEWALATPEDINEEPRFGHIDHGIWSPIVFNSTTAASDKKLRYGDVVTLTCLSENETSFQPLKKLLSFDEKIISLKWKKFENGIGKNEEFIIVGGEKGDVVKSTKLGLRPCLNKRLSVIVTKFNELAVEIRSAPLSSPFAAVEMSSDEINERKLIVKLDVINSSRILRIFYFNEETDLKDDYSSVVLPKTVLKVSMPEIYLCVFDSVPRDVVCLRTGVTVDLTLQEDLTKLNFTLGSLRLDNQIKDPWFVNLLRSAPVLEKKQKDYEVEDFSFRFRLQLDPREKHFHLIKECFIELHEIDLHLDSRALSSITKLADEYSVEEVTETSSGGLDGKEDGSTNGYILFLNKLRNIPFGARFKEFEASIAKDLYFGLFKLERLKFNLSYQLLKELDSDDMSVTAEDDDGAVDDLVLDPLSHFFQAFNHALQDIDNAPLALKGLILEEPTFTMEQFSNRLTKHFISEGKKNIFRLLGAVGILGGVGGAIGTIGGAGSAFVGETTGGLKDSPEGFGKGLVRGSEALGKGLVQSVAGITSSVSTTLAKPVQYLTFDNQYIAWKTQKKDKLIDLPDGVKSGCFGLFASISSGVVGIVKQPVDGCKYKGPIGLIAGIARGTIGVVTKPIDGVLGVITDTSEGLIAQTELAAEKLFDRDLNLRRRYPRIFKTKYRLLQLYSETEEIESTLNKAVNILYKKHKGAVFVKKLRSKGVGDIFRLIDYKCFETDNKKYVLVFTQYYASFFEYETIEFQNWGRRTYRKASSLRKLDDVFMGKASLADLKDQKERFYQDYSLHCYWSHRFNSMARTSQVLKRIKSEYGPNIVQGVKVDIFGDKATAIKTTIKDAKNCCSCSA